MQHSINASLASFERHVSLGRISVSIFCTVARGSDKSSLSDMSGCSCMLCTHTRALAASFIGVFSMFSLGLLPYQQLLIRTDKNGVDQKKLILSILYFLYFFCIFLYFSFFDFFFCEFFCFFKFFIFMVPTWNFRQKTREERRQSRRRRIQLPIKGKDKLYVTGTYGIELVDYVWVFRRPSHGDCFHKHFPRQTGVEVPTSEQHFVGNGYSSTIGRNFKTVYDRLDWRDLLCRLVRQQAIFRTHEFERHIEDRPARRLGHLVATSVLFMFNLWRQKKSVVPSWHFE